jgi:two-component system cell cycle response regulator
MATAVMGLGLLFEAVQASTGLGGHPLQVAADKYAYTLVELVAVSVCATRVWRHAEDRAAWALMALGLGLWTAGDLIWTLWLDNVSNPPFPSVADALYLAMYPALYASIMLLMRSRLRQAGRAQWLDGGVVGLAVAALAAALVFDAVINANQQHLAAEVVSAAYPVGDLVLLALVTVTFSLSGWRPGRGWALLGLGLVVTAGADLVYTYQSALGTYVAGGVLDVFWPASMALLALASWARVPRQSRDPVEAPHTIVLTLAAAIGALTLLVMAAFTHISALAVALAAGALVLASVRAALTYLENVILLRHSAREAMTDALTGLGNRRRLMQDLELAIALGSDEPSTLLFFDLNGFKRYNDSFGHAAGDALLTQIGSSLEAAVVGHGNAYRLGGDEFCVLLRGRYTPRDRIVVAAGSALVERGSVFTVTASLGLVVVPDEADSASVALQLADGRMYDDKARHSGIARGQTRNVLMQLLSERTPALAEHVTGVGELASDVASCFQLDAEELDELLRAAELHDIGKMAVPDAILDKPGPLSDDERQFVHQHPLIGERILSAAPALRPVARIVRSSHERWDGGGYPDGLAGIEIPLGARIVAVCDAYEAMTSDRRYQDMRSPEEALAELERQAGHQFDPQVVAALRSVFCSRADLRAAGAATGVES